MKFYSFFWSLLLTTLFLSSCAANKFTKRDVQSAQKLYGIDVQKTRIDTMYGYLQRNLAGYDSMHQYSLPAETFPAILFDPRPMGYNQPEREDRLILNKNIKPTRPDDLNDLAFIPSQN